MINDYPLEPIDATVARTFAFFDEASKRSKSEVERAEVRLEDALRTCDDDNWESGSAVRLAEEHFEKCEAEHAANLARCAWEAARSFAREIKPERPPVTPWIHSPLAWAAIFVHYKIVKPTT